jgi:hypothetical protein
VMKTELMRYQSLLTDSIKSFEGRKDNKSKDTLDLSDWWKSNSQTLPGFTYVFPTVLTNSPNSSPTERLFRIFKHETRPHGATPLPCVLGSRVAAWTRKVLSGGLGCARRASEKKKGKKKVKIPYGSTICGDGGWTEVYNGEGWRWKANINLIWIGSLLSCISPSSTHFVRQAHCDVLTLEQRRRCRRPVRALPDDEIADRARHVVRTGRRSRSIRAADARQAQARQGWQRHWSTTGAKRRV